MVYDFQGSNGDQLMLTFIYILAKGSIRYVRNLLHADTYVGQ